jgi:hypothetical protein
MPVLPTDHDAPLVAPLLVPYVAPASVVAHRVRASSRAA